jgi:predicted nucleic acid-binding protein
MKCLDTYALIEINNGNPKFTHLLNQQVIIPDIIFAEFYGMLYKKYDLKTAEYWHRKLSSLCRPVPREILLKATLYRINNKKQQLSFFDCIGYIFAREHNMLFVTGDKEFKKKEGVEFIQK